MLKNFETLCDTYYNICAYKMECSVNNNAFEVNPSPRGKRKRSIQYDNVYMNPALDLLSTEDAMCNTTMEYVPIKRSRRSRSCDDRAVFENPALDLGLSKTAVHGILKKELGNVNDKLYCISEILKSPTQLKFYRSFNDSLEIKPLQKKRSSLSPNRQNSTPVVQHSFPLRRSISFDLSFIEKLEIDDSVNEALYLDDDLNESNIMEIKAINTFKCNKNLNKNKENNNTNPFLNNYNDVVQKDFKKPEPYCDPNVNLNSHNNFPFDIPVTENEISASHIITSNSHTSESSYDATSDVSDHDVYSQSPNEQYVFPKRLFVNDTNETMSAYEPSILSQLQPIHQSTINENNIQYQQSIKCNTLDKQSKILGYDVRNINKNEIFNQNIKSNKCCCQPNDQTSNTINETRSLKNKKSSKLFTKIKDVFKHEKKRPKTTTDQARANPYEVTRPVTQESKVVSCFENPALSLADTESQEIDVNNDIVKDGSFKSANPFRVTPMKCRNYKIDNENDNIGFSHNDIFKDYINLSDVGHSSKKHVRFNTTLIDEKLITGNSFDSNITETNPLPSINESTNAVFKEIDSKIDDYHNELENCFNEKKLISQHIS